MSILRLKIGSVVQNVRYTARKGVLKWNVNNLRLIDDENDLNDAIGAIAALRQITHRQICPFNPCVLIGVEEGLGYKGTS